MNFIFLIGRLGSDPQAEIGKSGKGFTVFDLATNSKYMDEDGNAAEKTEWTPCILFGKNAETAMEYLLKGSRVLVQGEKATRAYIDKEGVKRSSVNCVVRRLIFLGEKKAAVDTGAEESFQSENFEDSHAQF